MPTQSTAVGFRLRGFGPAELPTYPGPVQVQFWKWVVDVALRVKDRELARGWDKNGVAHPLHPNTIKYRRSEVGPVTRTAPRLEPALKRSRVRSLLRGRAHHQSAELFWDFDAVSGDSFAVILHFAAEQGHDVFGISPGGMAEVIREATSRWRAWQSNPGNARPPLSLPGTTPVPKRSVKTPVPKRPVKRAIPKVDIGRTDIENFTLSSDGDKIREASAAGRFSGFRRLNTRGEQWQPGHQLGPGRRPP